LATAVAEANDAVSDGPEGSGALIRARTGPEGLGAGAPIHARKQLPSAYNGCDA
jgi:hypothetical protein